MRDRLRNHDPYPPSFIPRAVQPQAFPDAGRWSQMVTGDRWESCSYLAVMFTLSSRSSTSFPVLADGRQVSPASGDCPCLRTPTGHSAAHTGPAQSSLRIQHNILSHTPGTQRLQYLLEDRPPLDAITCISGPPWIPGKTALFSLCSFANSSLDRIRSAAWTSRSVLCVVVVVTCA